MSITKKIIITDTNIITDLFNANILEEFINLDNVYISDLVKNDEINNKTGNIEMIKKFKTLPTTNLQLLEVSKISAIEKKLSTYDLINFIIARDYEGILATGDKRLKNFSEHNGIEVYRTLKIIKLMYDKHKISKFKAIKACQIIKANNKTRIPINDINILLENKDNKLKFIIFGFRLYYSCFIDKVTFSLHRLKFR